LSEQTVLSCLTKQQTDSHWFGNPEGDGFGNQFRLFTQATISRVAVKMYKNGSPTGSIVARLYTSNGEFGSINAFAETQIAQSTDSVDVSALSTSPQDIDFTFDDVVLPPGTYFIVVFSSSIDNENGYVRLSMCENTGPNFGPITIWDRENSRWQSTYWWD
jgi:hypothetical protein